MPVPRRRKQTGSASALATISPTVLLSKIFDIDFMFQRSKTLLYYTFAPAVIFYGMTTQPCPASWLELINIFQNINIRTAYEREREKEEDNINKRFEQSMYHIQII